MAESYAGLESVCAVARRHGLAQTQIFTWRRELRTPVQLVAEQMFVPVIMEPAPKGAAAEPFSGVVYVFRSKRSDRLKLLWWDGTGVVLYAKRLEQGAFCWPKVQDGAMRLTSAQLAVLLDGMEWMRVLAPRRTRAPQVVA